MKPPHESTITIRGETYTHVKTRVYTPVSIYKGTTSFLRIGPKELLLPELDLHKNLLRLGFPVPQILEEGSVEDQYYYRESSLGEMHLGELFTQECAQQGYISDAHFQNFLALSISFAKAQLRTAKPENTFESFYYGILAPELMDELPHLKDTIATALGHVRAHTIDLPSVFTHGDLNAHNLFTKGVIDFGNSFEAPLGYDLVCNAYHTHLFPTEPSYERLRGYQFTPSQLQEYFSTLDILYEESGYAKLSGFIDTFLLCRSIWSCARMQSYPRIQAWRFAKFERILQAYLAGQSVLKEVMTD